MLRIELEYASHRSQGILRYVTIGFLTESAAAWPCRTHATVQIGRRSGVGVDPLGLLRPPSSDHLSRLVHGLLALDAVILGAVSEIARRAVGGPLCARRQSSCGFLGRVR